MSVMKPIFKGVPCAMADAAVNAHAAAIHICLNFMFFSLFE
jgi:hypothetical protein